MKPLPALKIVVSGLFGWLLGLFAFLVLPAYGLFMFFWLHASGPALLATLLPIALVCIGLAFLLLKVASRVARRNRPQVHAPGT